MLPSPPDMPAASTDATVPAGPGRRRTSWLRYSIVMLAGLALIAALKLAHQAVVPVLFSVFVALLLSPAVDMLMRLRIPREVAAVVVMVAVVALVAACLGATWHPARNLLETAPDTMRTLERKVRPLTRFIAKVESVSTQAGQITAPSTKSSDQPTPVALESKGSSRAHRNGSLPSSACCS